MKSTETDRLGTILPAGERIGRSAPKPRPRTAAWTVRILRWIGMLSLRRIHNLGGVVGRLMWWLPTEPKQNTLESLRLAFPDWPEAKRRKLARASLIHDGKMMIEHAAFWTWEREQILPLIRVARGGEWLDQAMRDGRGVILAATHLGAVEALNIYCSEKYAMSSQYREPRIRELDPFFRAARERYGAQLLPASKASVRLLLKGLRDGKLLGIPCDQDAGIGQGVFVPFFGELANTMTLISRLVQKSGAQVVLGYSDRRADGKGFDVHLVPLPDAFYTDDLVASATALNAALEACVLKLPAQYLWSYRRYRIRPESADPVPAVTKDTSRSES